MKCEHCGRGEAEYSFVQFRDPESAGERLCQNCMHTKSETEELLPVKAFLAWAVQHIPAETFRKMLRQTCFSCDRNFRDYLAGGFLGCEDCLKFFKPLLVHIGREMQESQNPSRFDLSKWEEGKRAAKAFLEDRPFHLPSSLRIPLLKERMEALIQDERYDEAKKLLLLIEELKTKPAV
ncbi:MAG: hypothetical protein JW893_07995 [Candidatus Omnitrophica bacterium]|nr:hypothetical protein [Candidatus Omnitrophota bacterium]